MIYGQAIERFLSNGEVLDGSTAAYSLEEIERACSHRDSKVSAAWREIARRARVLL